MSPTANNILLLLILQTSRFLVPLLLLPYLARTLEPNVWGEIIFAQASSQWLMLILEYGFSFSVTREISRHRDDKAKLAKIISDTVCAFLILLLISAFSVLCMGAFLPIFHHRPDYLFWAWALAVANSIAPLWYFQGFEQLAFPALLDLAVRVGSMVSIFLYVNQSSDAWMVLALQAIFTLISSMWMIKVVSLKIPISVSNFWAGWEMLKSGWNLFFFRSSASLYTSVNTLILGIVFPSAMIAYYSNADKIMRAIATPLCQSSSQVLFPKVSYMLTIDPRRAAKIALTSTILMSFFGVLLAILLFVCSPIITTVMLGDEYLAVIPLLRILCVCIPIISLINALGLQWVIPLGLDTSFNRVTIVAGTANILLIIPLSKAFGIIGAACAMLFSEFIVLFGLCLLIKSKDVGPIKILQSGLSRMPE